MQLQTFYDSGILFVDSLIRILKNNLDPAGSGSVIIIKILILLHYSGNQLLYDKSILTT